MQEVQRLIFGHAIGMTQAQIDESMGVEYLVIRRPDGSFVRATDQAQIDTALAAGGELLKLYRKAPNPQAYRELMNQGFGKPPKALQIEGSDGGPLEIRVKTPW